MIWIVKLDVGRGGKEILQLAKKKSPKKLSHPYQPMVERAIISRGATGKWQFNKDSFIQLTKFFVRKNQNTEICWSIFRRLHEVSEQETWESQELLMATTLEAALRTLDNHPFKGGDYSWKVRQSLSSFQNQYLGGKWDVACKEVLQIRDRLRNRNAHPDWLTHPDGSFSSEEWQQSIQDITFLSRFYGYMILALAGFKDLEPLFPNVQFLKKAEKQ